MTDNKCIHKFAFSGLKRAMIETGSNGERDSLDYTEWERWGEVAILVCTKCFGHKTVESKPIAE